MVQFTKVNFHKINYVALANINLLMEKRTKANENKIKWMVKAN